MRGYRTYVGHPILQGSTHTSACMRLDVRAWNDHVTKRCRTPYAEEESFLLSTRDNR